MSTPQAPPAYTDTPPPYFMLEQPEENSNSEHLHQSSKAKIQKVACYIFAGASTLLGSALIASTTILMPLLSWTALSFTPFGWIGISCLAAGVALFIFGHRIQNYHAQNILEQIQSSSFSEVFKKWDLDQLLSIHPEATALLRQKFDQLPLADKMTPLTYGDSWNDIDEIIGELMILKVITPDQLREQFSRETFSTIFSIHNHMSLQDIIRKDLITTSLLKQKLMRELRSQEETSPYSPADFYTFQQAGILSQQQRSILISTPNRRRRIHEEFERAKRDLAHDFMHRTDCQIEHLQKRIDIIQKTLASISDDAQQTRLTLELTTLLDEQKKFDVAFNLYSSSKTQVSSSKKGWFLMPFFYSKQSRDNAALASQQQFEYNQRLQRAIEARDNALRECDQRYISLFEE